MIDQNKNQIILFGVLFSVIVLLGTCYCKNYNTYKTNEQFYIPLLNINKQIPPSM